MNRLALLYLLSTPCHALDANVLINIIECESSGNHLATNGKVLEGDDGSSVGVMQFQKATFEEFKKRAGHPEWRWKNAVHQMRLAVWMIEHGYARRWTCFRKLYPPMD